MQSRSRSLQVTRRQLLQSAASASLAVSVAGPAILGRAQAQQKTVSFAGWAFEPQVVEANVKRFMEQNKDLAVKYMPLDLQLYNEKMVALINANNDPDCFYVRDTNLGAWVEAGWVQPIDGKQVHLPEPSRAPSARSKVSSSPTCKPSTWRRLD